MLARAGLGELLTHDPGDWPWSTFAANVVGAALLGWVHARLPDGTWERSLLAAGFCGGLTTFSALQLELLELVDAGRLGVALLYAGGSVTAGLLAVRAAGLAAGERVR